MCYTKMPKIPISHQIGPIIEEIFLTFMTPETVLFYQPPPLLSQFVSQNPSIISNIFLIIKHDIPGSLDIKNNEKDLSLSWKRDFLTSKCPNIIHIWKNHIWNLPEKGILKYMIFVRIGVIAAFHHSKSGWYSMR